MKITLKFYSAWAIGSGKGGESKDSIILKDDNGLPFIPGRTLKGLLRDAFLDCGYDKDEAIILFGQEKSKDEDKKVDLKTGKLRVNSAYLPDEFTKLTKEEKAKLFYAKMATRLDDDKQAVNHSLRKNEVVIPLTLEATILNDENTELSDENYKKIENALKMLKILGEKRYRGLGRVKATAEKFVPNTTDNKDNIKINKNVARFRCTVTELLILMRKSKTDQNVASLDYIPGSTFRGVIAGVISNDINNDEFNDIIFNNTVQFGDAHLVINEKRSLKIPFTFYYDKNKGDSTLYNFHHLKDEYWETKKLKAYKKGYIQEKIIKEVEYANRVKSSRSREHRSSEEGGMFVYHYIKKGQVFEFEIRSDNKTYLTQIAKILNGKTKYFGKSKTAEFGGAIKITYLEEKDKETPTTKGNYLYAESNLCFLNKYGEFTAHPTEADLGVSNGAKINWEKSQIKFRTYAPYNYHRQNWDAERLIIEKGSVFVFKDEVEVTFDKEKLQKGLGCFLTEGYGRVLINPEFLNEKEIEYKEISTEPNDNKPTDSDNTYIKYLKNKVAIDTKELGIDDVVKTYADKNKFLQKKTSQWARVFNATTRAKDFTELKCILKNECTPVKIGDQSILTGGSKNWEKKDIKTIDDFLTEVTGNEIFALRKLSKKMIKITKDKNN